MEDATTSDHGGKKSYLCELVDSRQGSQVPEATRLGGDDSPFTGYISQTLNRSRSPDSAVKIRLTHDALGTVEIGWAFSHGKVKDNDKVQKQLKGERFDEAARQPVPEAIPGWTASFVAILGTHCNGAPSHVTFRLDEL